MVEKPRTPSIRLVEAGAADLPIMAGLLVQQMTEHSLPAEPSAIRQALEEVVRNPTLGFLLAAYVAEGPVGVAYVSLVWSLEHGGRAAWLEELYVTPEHRDRGVGRSLLRAAMARARELGCRAVDLEVDEGHRRAENLYRREGFVPLPRQRWVRIV